MLVFMVSGMIYILLDIFCIDRDRMPHAFRRALDVVADRLF